MYQTFEERLSEHLDCLYQGALFLSGGAARDAELLVVETAVVARDEHRNAMEEGAFEPWLEGRLVQCFLDWSRRFPRRVDAPGAPNLPRSRPAHAGRDGADNMLLAASAIPVPARAAIWLVLLRRWTYEDAAREMGVERSRLRELLRHRLTLVDALDADSMAGRSRRSGIEP